MTSPGDIEISAADAQRAIAQDSATLVDVRRPDERSEGTIDGAIEIVLDELMQRSGEIPRDRTVIFYCRTGSRSIMAAQAFRQGGYDAYSLAGGFEAWPGG